MGIGTVGLGGREVGAEAMVDKGPVSVGSAMDSTLIAGLSPAAIELRPDTCNRTCSIAIVTVINISIAQKRADDFQTLIRGCGIALRANHVVFSNIFRVRLYGRFHTQDTGM